MGLLAYILKLPGNNDACGASTAWDIYLLPPSSLIFIPPPIYPFFLPLSLILYTSSSPYSFFLCMCVSISIIYPILIIVFICISSFYLCVSLPSTRSISLSLVYPILLLLLIIFLCLYVYFYFLPYFYFWTDLGNVCHYNKYMEKIFNHPIIHIFTNELKSIFYPPPPHFFYVCMYIFIFTLFLFFWTDLGNVCHYNKYMEKFLTVQSSIYLQTNSKTYFIPLLLIFLCLYVYFYFFTLFLFFWTDLGNVCHSNKSMEKIFNHQIIHIFTNEIKKTYFIYFFIF